MQKMTGPDAKSATAMGEEVGVSQATLSRWLKSYGRFGSTGGGMNSKENSESSIDRIGGRI